MLTATPEQQQRLYDTLRGLLGTELEACAATGSTIHARLLPTPPAAASTLPAAKRRLGVFLRARRGIPEFRYGNVFEQPILDILDNGRAKSVQIHQAHGFDSACQGCGHLSTCHTGCPVVKRLRTRTAAPHLRPAKAHLRRRPPTYPPTRPTCSTTSRAAVPAATPRPGLRARATARARRLVLPATWAMKNTLPALVGADPVLRALFDGGAFVLELGGLSRWNHQLLKPSAACTLVPGDRVVLHLRRDLLAQNCPEGRAQHRHLQMLRDTPVVYGDEQRASRPCVHLPALCGLPAAQPALW